MALVQQPMDFRFPWYQQAGSAQAPPESSAGTASQPQAQAQHQQQSADVEREFQAAMQFYSRGGGSGGALRLCQEPLVPYKPLASGSQSKSQKQQQQQQPATAVKSRRPSKDGAVQTDLSLPLPAWSPGPTPLTALLGASVDSKDGEGAVEELQRERQPRQPALRRSSSFVELTTRPTAGDSAGRPPPSPSIRRRGRRRRRFCGKEQPRRGVRPTSATPAAGARPAQRGPRLGGDERSITGLHCGEATCDSMMSWGRTPTKVYMGTSLWTAAFPSRAPVRQPQPRKASVFPEIRPARPGSAAGRIPDRLELVERAGSGPVASRGSPSGRPAQASGVAWRQHFDQALSLNWHFVCF
uniref:AT-hook motif nuclear-localized protein n=1 Tax=Macrostomum lignano TaxID=282301 RepID=A0A1I8F3K8_9PLAT